MYISLDNMSSILVFLILLLYVVDLLFSFLCGLKKISDENVLLLFNSKFGVFFGGLLRGVLLIFFIYVLSNPSLGYMAWPLLLVCYGYLVIGAARVYFKNISQP